MVKGTSRQVIVVHAPDRELFEQAIFILKEDAVGSGVTDDVLLKEAEQAIRGSSRQQKHRHFHLYGAVWAAVGAVLTGVAWVITILIG